MCVISFILATSTLKSTQDRCYYAWGENEEARGPGKKGRVQTHSRAGVALSLEVLGGKTPREQRRP